MARIESLNVLLTDSGKVYLAEQYGAVKAFRLHIIRHSQSGFLTAGVL